MTAENQHNPVEERDEAPVRSLQELATQTAALRNPAPTAASNENDPPLALISDIHANLEALKEVLAEIDRRGITRIACLGDVVGYGPNPLECMDLVIERCEFCLMGNHDFAIFFEPHNFNAPAESAAFWTRAQFEQDTNLERRNRRWKSLGEMPTRVVQPRFLAVHGSPRRPINEYIFPDDIYVSPPKMAAIFDRITHLCFVGHTHVPGVFVPDPDFYSPDELNGRFMIGPERVIINVGSVGQPRDRNPKASFAIVHGDSVEFVRVAYDIQTTVEKIQANDALDDYLGTRLTEGK